MRCFDGLDYLVYYAWTRKTDYKIKRLLKVSTNVHNQIGDAAAKKS